jgi:hypothetical protein
MIAYGAVFQSVRFMLGLRLRWIFKALATKVFYYYKKESVISFVDENVIHHTNNAFPIQWYHPGMPPISMKVWT